MKPNLYILKATNRLILYEQVIKEVFETSFTKIKTRLKLPTLDVVVRDNPKGVIPEIGVGGYTPDAHTLFVSLDPSYRNFKEMIKKELPRTFAHEAHHSARWSSVGYGKTLLEALISEGLADHFDIEINKGEVPMWARALSTAQTSKLIIQAKKEFNSIQFDERAWMFGSVEKNIPKWTGYSLGFELVRRYIEIKDKKASELVNTEAEKFIV